MTNECITHGNLRSAVMWLTGELAAITYLVTVAASIVIVVSQQEVDLLHTPLAHVCCVYT